VQPKAITFPTNAKLMHKARVNLVKLAKASGVPLRQSYARLGKRALVMHGRYAHAKQFKRANRELRRLRTYLGRVIRDNRRKTAGDEGLTDVFAEPLGRAIQVRHQRQRQRGPKLYSLRATEVRCIGKGKAHAPYEFGCKVSVATTNKRASDGRFVAHIKALPGNPFDGHTLKAVIEDTQRLTGVPSTPTRGYQGHTTIPTDSRSTSPAASAGWHRPSGRNSADAPPSRPSSNT